MKHSKKYAIFITCLFVLCLALVFVANAVTPDRESSALEKRTLAQLPAASVATVFNGEFMQDFETYVTDQFVLRDQWISIKAVSEAALGKQENNGVYICDQGTLIPRFTVTNLTLPEKNVGYVDKLAALTDVPVYFSLIPGKLSLWADRLPYGAPNADEGTYLTMGSGVQNAKWIDVGANLAAHAGEDIYYRTDHHWTSLGAYYGYEALAAGMGLTPTPLSSYTKTTVDQAFYGTAYSSSKMPWIAPDVIDTYVPQDNATVEDTFSSAEGPKPGALYNPSMLSEDNIDSKYAYFLGGNKPLSVVKSTVAPAGAPKLLLVRDSFSDSLAPFLTANFSEVHLVDPRYYKTSMGQYVKDNGIDMVLVLYSVDNFVSDPNLFTLSMPVK